ncbi:metallophosphoesterase family protein [Spongisporangium articulatum]|uniref:Metallophosphoesterase family protein n=1 Tax=Spongisporangium articulatum TaxID=3362603 RepID=A0ABW8ANP7_9ACTN
MRIGVVADVHGNLPALEAVAAALADDGVDLVVNCGDIVSGPVDPAGVADFLTAPGRAWVSLAGNHERQVLTRIPSRVDDFTYDHLGAARLEWLATLAPTLEPAPGVLACHGSPTDDLQYLLETVDPAIQPGALRRATPDEVAERLVPARTAGLLDGVTLLLVGHTHLARELRLGGLYIVNPGSVGWPAYDDDVPSFHVVEAGSPHARYAIVTGSPDEGWSAEYRQVVYDWDAAADAAAQNGFPDIGAAMRTGFLPQ